jgi:hypothetical protein
MFAGFELAQWSATGEKPEKLREWRLPGVVNKLALTSDGRYLFTANQNGTVYVLRLDAPPGAGPPR